VPEGDTIHRLAARLESALGGREIEVAEAPDPRSPLHRRAADLTGRTLESAEARGKHLLLHFSDDVAVHGHLGVNGRWRVRADGRRPFGRPWLLLTSGQVAAGQFGGKLLRMTTEFKLRSDPALAALGPDVLAPDFDAADAVSRLRSTGAGMPIAEALLDQRILAGIGNAIANGACFAARISPWRKVAELSDDELGRVVAASRGIMEHAVARGRRPPSVYRADRRGCPSCGGRVSVRGQGDANRATYWCPRCQPG
jgi:endonuclease VIII